MSDLLRRTGHRAVSFGGMSILLRPALALGCLALLGLLFMLFVFALPAGSFDLAPTGVLRAIFRPDMVSGEHRYIVWDIRLPRILMAILAGAMLGFSGAAMQSITRNGLADPGLIGVKEGAAVMVLSLIILFPQTSLFWRPAVGMLGGLGVAILVILMARDLSRIRFVLIGIGVSWFFSAAIGLFMTTANIRDVQTALVWLAGSLHAATWPLVGVAALWTVIGSGLLYLTARSSDVALLGNGTAIGLGVRIRTLSFIRFAGPVLLTATSVSCVGNLGFVGLVAPHMARFLIGGNQMALLTSSALIGSTLVLLADTVGRVAFAPLQIPAGIVMSVLGVPFFLLLLWQRRDRL